VIAALLLWLSRRSLANDRAVTSRYQAWTGLALAIVAVLGLCLCTSNAMEALARADAAEAVAATARESADASCGTSEPRCFAATAAMGWAAWSSAEATGEARRLTVLAVMWGIL